MSTELTNALMSYFTGPSALQASGDVKSYFSKRGERFTGSEFEHWYDTAHPNEITEKDLFAVTLLGVDIPPRAALWILSDSGRLAIWDLLSPVPAGLEIWQPQAAPYLRRRRELWDLWDLLGRAYWPQQRRSGGLGGFTKRSKLLAAKRPHLMPILDGVVRSLLPPVANHWAEFRGALLNPKNRETIMEVTQDAPEDLSLLRRIDVVLWMAGRR